MLSRDSRRKKAMTTSGKTPSTVETSFCGRSAVASLPLARSGAGNKNTAQYVGPSGRIILCSEHKYFVSTAVDGPGNYLEEQEYDALNAVDTWRSMKHTSHSWTTPRN